MHVRVHARKRAKKISVHAHFWAPWTKHGIVTPNVTIDDKHKVAGKLPLSGHC